MLSRSSWPALGLGLCCALALLLSLSPSAPARAPAPPDPFYGVVLQQDALGPAAVTRLRRGSVGTVRFLISWAQVERVEGEFDFSSLDAKIERIREAGAEPLPFVYGSPRWLGSEGPPIGSERTQHAWEDFLHVLVHRYGAGGELATEDDSYVPIERWQIWNEPNLPSFWSPRTPSPSEYVELLRISEQAIHGVDPDASLIAAGMPAAPNSIPSPVFIAAVYQRYAELGIKPSFDELAVHPYASRVRGTVANVEAFSAAVRAAIGPTARLPPLLISEVGWESRVHPNHMLSGTPREQVRRLKRVYEALAARRWALNISAVLWYAWRDVAPDTGCVFCSDVGLISYDGAPKPAWTAFRELTR